MHNDIRKWIRLVETTTLIERVETADFTTKSGNTFSVPIHWNPSAQMLYNLIQRSEESEQRGMFIDPRTAVFWDSYAVEHYLVGKWLKDQGIHLPDECEMVVRNPPPILFVAAAHAQAPVIQRLAVKFEIET